jgi:hypothetical protein
LSDAATDELLLFVFVADGETGTGQRWTILDDRYDFRAFRIGGYRVSCVFGKILDALPSGSLEGGSLQ